MRPKSIQLRLMLFGLILMHFASCFLSSSLCNALGWGQKTLSKMHSDEAKKHSASPHAFWPHPHAFCFMLFVLILVQWILGILDAANLGPLFKILQNSLKQKHLGFLKHLKKWFMGCLVQVSQTPPPAGVSIKFTPQSNRNNDSLSKVNTIVYKNLYVNMF